MRQKRFFNASLVESAILGLIILILVGAGIVMQLNGNEHAALGADTASSAMPSPEAIPAVGEIIALPSSSSLSGGLTLVRTDKAPTFSEQEAMQVLQDFGIPIGKKIRGDQPFTCAATYGVGTLGRSGGPGLPWWGVRNIPLKGTDVVLDHVENRPMWIIDCDNAYAAGSQAIFKHAVYAVDEQTRSILTIWFYDVIESTIETPVVPGN